MFWFFNKPKTEEQILSSKVPLKEQYIAMLEKAVQEWNYEVKAKIKKVEVNCYDWTYCNDYGYELIWGMDARVCNCFNESRVHYKNEPEMEVVVLWEKFEFYNSKYWDFIYKFPDWKWYKMSQSSDDYWIDLEKKLDMKEEFLYEEKEKEERAENERRRKEDIVYLEKIRIARKERPLDNDLKETFNRAQELVDLWKEAKAIEKKILRIRNKI